MWLWNSSKNNYEENFIWLKKFPVHLLIIFWKISYIPGLNWIVFSIPLL